MTTMIWRDLFLETLRNPAGAAERVLVMDVPRSVLNMGVVASSACNAALSGLLLLMFPPPPIIPELFLQPFMNFLMIAGFLLLFSHLLVWSGRTLGGLGGFDEVLKLMVWLHFVRLALQILGFLVLVLFPFSAGLFQLLVGALSLWIALHFIRAAHGLASLGQAAMTLFLAGIGLFLAIIVILALLGVGGMEGMANV